MSQQVPDGAVTLREVYTLLDKTRAELLAEVRAVKAHVDQKFTEHDGEHMRDAEQRERIDMHRASRIRWAVTTIIAGLGVLVAIYAAAKTGGI